MSDDRRAWANELFAALLTLPETCSITLRHRYFEGLSEAQISQVTGLTTAQVRRAAAQGMAQLGRLLTRMKNDATISYLGASERRLAPEEISTTQAIDGID